MLKVIPSPFLPLIITNLFLQAKIQIYDLLFLFLQIQNLATNTESAISTFFSRSRGRLLAEWRKLYLG